MAKFDQDTITRWTKMADAWMEQNYDGVTRGDILLGAKAWAIAHRCGVTEEAYSDRSVVDAHIVTALKKIFPNAVFNAKYTY